MNLAVVAVAAVLPPFASELAAVCHLMTPGFRKKGTVRIL